MAIRVIKSVNNQAKAAPKTEKDWEKEAKAQTVKRAHAQRRIQLDLSEQEKLEKAMARARAQANAEIQEVIPLGSGITLTKFKGDAGHQYQYPSGYSLEDKVKRAKKKEEKLQDAVN